jgi:hypothetical protein
LERDFEDLLERCRMFIETSSTFDSSGLQDTMVAERHVLNLGTDTKQTAWELSGSEFYAVKTEWTSRDGPVWHRCDVYLIDEERILEPLEQGLLLRRFLMLQVQLIGAGSHEFDRELSPIPPAIIAAFLLSERNPEGCKVANSVALTPDGTFFSAGVGERVIQKCYSK